MPRRRRRSRKLPQGFTQPGYRPFWNLLFESMGIRGKEKRRFLNQQAGAAALGIGIAIGAAGLQFFGFWGGIICFFIGCYLGGVFVTNQRFFR